MRGYAEYKWFYLDLSCKPQQQLTLPTQTSSRLIQVLRASIGQKIVLFNGDGLLAVAEILKSKKDRSQSK